MSVDIFMLCAAGAIIAPAVGWEIAKRWPRSSAKKAASMRQAFISKRMSEGLTLDKVISEMGRFETLARIRRRASAVARGNPAITEEAIRAVAKEELMSMAAATGNTAEARFMAKAIDSLLLEDLLEPDVYAVWLRTRLAKLPDLLPATTADHEDAISAYAGRI